MTAQLKLAAFAEYVGLSSFHVEINDKVLSGELSEYVGVVTRVDDQATVVVMFARAEAALRQQYSTIDRNLAIKAFPYAGSKGYTTTHERLVKPGGVVVTPNFSFGRLATFGIPSCESQVLMPSALVCRESATGYSVFRNPRGFHTHEVLKIMNALRAVAYAELVSHLNANFPTLLAEPVSDLRSEQADVALW